MDQFAHYLPGMLVAYGAFTLAVMSPGPNMIAVIGTAMGAGRRPGIALACGISVGSFGWGVLAILGLTSLIAKYASAIGVVFVEVSDVSHGCTCARLSDARPDPP
jgi:amino acid exporter